MKRAIFVLSLFIASAVLGDERSEKRQLISELLELLDARRMTQAAFENLMTGIATFSYEGRDSAEPTEEYGEELRAEFEAEERKQEAERRAFMDRMYAQIDYAKYFDETYVPLFENEFSVDELRQLVDFLETRPGRKFASIVPRLSGATQWRRMKEAGEAAAKELEREEAAKHPWRQTMADLRSIATAVEAHGVDTEKYPAVAFDELEAAIAPTYIREVPKADSWGTPFFYISDGKNYRLVSAGADKRFEWSSRNLDLSIAEPRFSESLDADIIFQNGTFVQSPKMAQDQ